MTDNIHSGGVRNLPKAGRAPVRLRMHVQWLVGRGRALRWIMRGTFRHAAKPGHLFGCEELTIIGPTLRSLGCSDLHEPAFEFEDLQLLAVFHRGRSEEHTSE